MDAFPVFLFGLGVGILLSVAAYIVTQNVQFVTARD